MIEITPEQELFKGWRVIVTGAGSGLGKATAAILAYQGASLILADLNQASGDKTVEELKSQFPNASITFVKCDITNEVSVDQLFASATQNDGTLQALAHCAGIFSEGKEIHEMTLSSFERELKVNTTGTFLMNRAAVKQFIAQNERGVAPPQGGWSIVNVGSKASTAGNREATAYTASKHGVLGISRCVAVEQARNKIRCNCLCPGPVDTPLTRQGTNVSLDAPIEELNAKLLGLGILDAILLKRLGTAEDIGHQLAYLLGPRAQFITNAAVAIDGGWI